MIMVSESLSYRHFLSLLMLCLFTALASQAQSANKIAKNTHRGETWVKTANLHNLVDCSLQPSTTYISNKRIIFTSPSVSLDLKIYKRTKKQWYARDPEGNQYLIVPVTHAERPNEPCLLFLPDPQSGLLGVMISNFDVCGNPSKTLDK